MVGGAGAPPAFKGVAVTTMSYCGLIVTQPPEVTSTMVLGMFSWRPRSLSGDWFLWAQDTQALWRSSSLTSSSRNYKVLSRMQNINITNLCTLDSLKTGILTLAKCLTR